jgi:hypothetical protein
MWTLLWLACRDPAPQHIRRTEPAPAPAPAPTPAPASEPEESGTTGETGLPTLDCTAPFQPCGGDFRDTVWRFLGVCEGDGFVDSHAICGDLQATWLNTYEGTVQFASDLTYRFDLTAHVSESHHHWPPQCAPSGCEALGLQYGETCSDDGAGGCFCEYVEDRGAEVLEGEWWVDAYYGQNHEINVGQVYANGSMSFEQWRWCASGDELRVGDKFGNVQVLVREP